MIKNARTIDVFADKSALLIEWLLSPAHRDMLVGTRELAEKVNVDPALATRVLAQLCFEGYGERDNNTAAFVLKDHKRLLEAWSQSYRITQKCRIRTFKSAYFSKPEILQKLTTLKVDGFLCRALHAAAESHGAKTLLHDSLEFYVTDFALLKKLSRDLKLEASDEGYDICFIEPYYKSMVQRSVKHHKKNHDFAASPFLLTYLDLLNFPLRGREAAERLFLQETAGQKAFPSLAIEQDYLEGALRALGGYRDQIVITGGMALVIYKLYLTKNKSALNPLATVDIDALVSRKLKREKESLFEALKREKFTHVFKDLGNPPTEMYQDSGRHFELEFLTDMKSRQSSEKNVKICGITAQPLRYVEMGLLNKIPFETKTSLQAWVVSPGAWAFHKALTFTKRKSGSSKFYKDLYGIWYVFSQLDALSVEAKIQCQKLQYAHPSWAKKARSNLRTWIYAATPKDWSYLSQQEPSGTLHKKNFLQSLRDVFL